MEKQFKLFRHPQFGFVYGEDIRTPEGTFIWVHLAVPRDPPPPQEGQLPGKPRFEISTFFPKDGKQTADFVTQMKPMSDAMVAKFNEKAKAKLAGVDFLQDGDTFDHEKYPFLKGQYVLTARKTFIEGEALKWKVLDNATPKNTLERNAIFGGQEGVLVVRPLLTSHGMGYQISLVQLRKDSGNRITGLGGADESILDDDNEETVSNEKVDTSSQEGLNAAMNKL